MFIGSLPCLCLDLHVYGLFAMFMSRSMPMCSLPYLCLDLHAYVFFTMPMLRSMCLCALCHACVLRSMLVTMSCTTLSPFFPLYLSFLCFGLSGRA